MWRRYPFIAILLLAGGLNSANARMGKFVGVPRIVDGDTVQFGEVKVRMEGIDAPQTDQLCLDEAGVRWKCGVTAREQLKALAGNKSWKCYVIRKSVYGRLVARCRVDRQDIALQMIRNGWAMVSAAAPVTYLAGQQEATDKGAGLWAGAFIAPLDWRQHNWHAKTYGRLAVHPQTSDAMLTSAFGSLPPSPDCAIKGNVNTSGKCIFHTPGGRWYKRIKMEAKRGDRWFCSPVEAAASGCRETRR